jgi:hemoglobin
MSDISAQEIALRNFVVRFYELARADTELSGLFENTMMNWDQHIDVVCDFWSHTILGTKRYKGPAYVAHTRLPIEWKHFDLWLAAAQQASTETLTPDLADRVMARGRHMTASFKAGLFPFKGPNGTWARSP